MDEQTKKAREQAKQLSGKEKRKHFFYYYKYHIFIAVFLIAITAFTITECTHKVKYDLEISCYSSIPLNNTVDSFLAELEKQIDDITKNDKKEVGLYMNFADLSNPSQQNQTVLMKLSAELAGGNSMGYMFDEEFYNFISENSSECFEDFILISDIPWVREFFGLSEGQKLYWASKILYETEKNDIEKIEAHENALKVQSYFNSQKKL